MEGLLIIDFRFKIHNNRQMRIWIKLFIIGIALIIAGCTGKQNSVSSLNDLKGGKTFAVATGTVVDQFVLKKFPDAKLKYFNSVLDCAIAVKEGKADATAYDKPILKNIAAKNDGLKVLDELLSEDQYGFAVQLQNKELKNVIDGVLIEIKENGTYDDMMKRWFPEKGNPAPMPDSKLNGKNGVFRFGTAAVTEPMSFFDTNHSIVGFDIEFATYVAQKLGKKLEVVDMEFGAMLPALISGKVDMVGAGLSITAERAKRVLFSECYYPNGIAAIVRTGNQPPVSVKAVKMKGIDDIRDKRIGVLLGSIHDSYATKNFPTAKIMQFQNVPDMLMALNTGKVDVAFNDDVGLPEIFKSNPELGTLVKNLYSVGIGAGFNDANDALREQFNTYLKEIKSNGVYDDMISRWMDKGITEMPEIKNTGKNGQLKVGVVSNIGMPCSFIDKGKLSGFDIEVAMRFAAYLEKEFVPVDMPFGSLIASISTNKIDMITASMMITDEREKQIDFSDPYFSSGISVIACNANIAPSEKFSRLDNLKDRKIGVLLGSVYDKYASTALPAATIMQYQNIPDMLVALNSGKIDAAFVGDVALPEILKTNPDVGVLISNIIHNDLAAGFNKENSQLRDKFNEFLHSIKSNGVYDDMVNRWMKKRDLNMPEIKGSASNGDLRAGVVGDIGLPFIIMKDGNLTGFDIELGKRFAVWLGKRYIPVDMPFGSLIASISTNKIDLITSSMMVTDERKKMIDFSEGYYTGGGSIIAKNINIAATEPGKFTKLDDIADKKIGVFTGTVHDGFVARTYPKAQIFRYDGTADMMLSVKTGKIDAAMFDAITARLVLKRNPELVILSDEVLSMELGVGFNKNNPALRNEFNQFMKKIRSDGTYDEMHKRWFSEDAEDAKMPDIPNNPDGKKLVVAVSVEDLPYVAYVNGEYVGFDIEMIRRFAQHGHYNLEFMQMEFPSLIAALASGKADMITDGICINAERAKQIDFSDCYAYFKTAVVVAKKNMAGFNANEEKPVSKGFFEKVSNSFYSNIILEKRYLLIIDGLKVTIIISILSAILGTLIGGLICFMKMSKNKILSLIANLYISLIRGTPVLVLLMIIFYVVFASVNINPVIVAVIAFGINFGAYVSEMFRTSIESIDKGQREAGIAGGFSKVQTFVNIIMPQALRHVLPIYKGEFISLVKMTSIVGYIAVQDLTKASDIIRSRTFDAFFPLIMAAVLYIIIAGLLTWALSYVEISVDPKRKKIKKEMEVNL
jgi:polar amino acid transport system substrate-binding protein